MRGQESHANIQSNNPPALRSNPSKVVTTSPEASLAPSSKINIDFSARLSDPSRRYPKKLTSRKKTSTRSFHIGGSTCIPKVQQSLKEFLGGREPSKGIGPEEAVAYVAATQVGVLNDEEGMQDSLLVDVDLLP